MEYQLVYTLGLHSTSFRMYWQPRRYTGIGKCLHLHVMGVVVYHAKQNAAHVIGLHLKKLNQFGKNKIMNVKKYFRF